MPKTEAALQFIDTEKLDDDEIPMGSSAEDFTNFNLNEARSRSRQPNPSFLTEEILSLHDQDSYEIRFFGCRPCNNLFYDKVEKSKPASKCPKCRRCYVAIPVKDEPVGLGFFKCSFEECTKRKIWTTYPAAHDVPQQCYGCENEIFPFKIIPSVNFREKKDWFTSKPGHVHSCYACRNLPEGKKCPFKGRYGFQSSIEHDCSGSTVSLDSETNYKKVLAKDKIDQLEDKMKFHEYGHGITESEENDDRPFILVASRKNKKHNRNRACGACCSSSNQSHGSSDSQSSYELEYNDKNCMSRINTKAGKHIPRRRRS